MSNIENSEVMRRVLSTLFHISRRKTTAGYAVFTMDNLLRELEEKFSFLRHVEIKDTRYVEDDDTISVLSEIDNVNPSEFGNALQEIISKMNISLGNNAGHFFIREIQKNLGDEFNTTMKDFGVDLGVMQLESEVHRLEKDISKKKLD